MPIAMHSSPETCTSTLARMRAVLALHLDLEQGSPFWIECARARGVRADDFASLDDLALLGPMDEDAMRSRPLTDFIPRRVLAERQRLIPSETGGATGAPKLAVFTEEEFHAGFVAPFVRVAEHIGFPRDGRWLFVGPTGPHIIGRAARHLARVMGADEPFTVDFDPRWHRRLLPGSVAERRHIDHIVEQALRVMRRVEITVLFITPSVLASLTPLLSDAHRMAVGGIHFGGQALGPDARAAFRESFPRAVQVAGYGNSMVGVCMEVPRRDHTGLSYHAPAPRHVVRLLADPARSLTREVEAGMRGRVLVHRLDESFLLLNMVERDEATRLPGSPEARALGLAREGIGDPGPPQSGDTVQGSIY